MRVTAAAPLRARDEVKDAEGTPDRSTSRMREVAPVWPVSIQVSAAPSAMSAAAFGCLPL